MKLEDENAELSVAARELLARARTVADIEMVRMLSATGVLELTLCCADTDEINGLRGTTGGKYSPVWIRSLRRWSSSRSSPNPT